MSIACQRDAYAAEGESQVLSVRPDGQTWVARLADAVLYPEGGGQPCDHGAVDGVPVLHVGRDDGGLTVRLAGPVREGWVPVRVDWARRYDHMQQHTAQHLLSAVAQDRFGLATTAFHLHEGPLARCDVTLDGPVPPAVREGLQAALQREIRAARPVTVEEVEPAALAGLGVRSRGLPEGHTGPVRLVRIEGLDLNTCGGTHLRSTAEIGALALLGAEAVKGGTRLHFVAGDRVLARLGAAEAALAEAGALLSRGPAEVVDGLRRLLDDARATAKARDARAAELADTLGDLLATGPGPLRAAHRATGDAAFLNRVAARVLAADPGGWLLLTAGEGEEGAFLLAGPPDRVAEVRPLVLDALRARGGGAPGRLQGRAERLSGREALLARLRSALAEPAGNG